MRKKELKLVVTFHTTADAMAMEKACKENNTPVESSRFQELSQQDVDFPGARHLTREKRSLP